MVWLGGTPAGLPSLAVRGGGRLPAYELNARSAVSGVRSALEADSDDIDVVVLSDSTADGSTDWVYLLATDLAENYPAFTVEYALWSDGSQAYPAATELQAGSGSHTLRIWNGSVSGAGHYYPQSSRLALMCTDKAPDLLIVSHGHNSPSGDVEYSFKARSLQLIEAAREVLPTVPALVVAQNPQTSGTDAQSRAQWLRDISALRGYGFIDICQVFLNYGSAWSTDLMTDSVHPNSTGQRRWADAMLAVFSTAASALVQETPCFTQVGANLLPNADFSAFAGALPDSWSSAGSPTVAKDETNFETGSWSVSVTTTGAGGRIFHTLANPTSYVGKYLTLAARGYLPAGSVGRSTTGRIGISTNISGVNSAIRTQLVEGFWWECLTFLIPVGTTTINIILYGDSAAGTGYETVWDRACLVEGVLPFDQQ